MSLTRPNLSNIKKIVLEAFFFSVLIQIDWNASIFITETCSPGEIVIQNAEIVILDLVPNSN
jgi:hypothetical protein